jgi:hypothetical protein
MPPKIKPTTTKQPDTIAKPVSLEGVFDATVWAESFIREFGQRRQDINQQVMTAWFANAIETGRKEGKRQAAA